VFIIVKPSRDAEGRKAGRQAVPEFPGDSGKGFAYSTRGQLFDGTVDGRMIVNRSTQPMLDGARALLAEGADPATRLVMRHEGQDYDALRSTIGAAARMTVRDDRTGKPVFVKWQPNRFRADQSSASAPLMHQNEKAGA
jgi:hypothetical protein